MRVLIFHGYLLHGTGSNVYNANLAAALVRLGHEVHLLCQDRAPWKLPFVDAVADWDAGALDVRVLREPVRCTVYRPALSGLLPVYVADRYDGIEARRFSDCTDDEVKAYVDANVAAVREVAARVQPDVALANHLVMGPLVFARALGARGAGAGHVAGAGGPPGARGAGAGHVAGAGGPPGAIPYAVKIHGSALEYTVAPQPERFLAAAEAGVAGARGVLVGSRHTAERLWATVTDPALPERTRQGPPGVDVARFAPREPDAARAGLAALAARLAARAAEAPAAAVDTSAFARDDAEAAAALADVARGAEAGDRLVAFVGKLIVSKGIDLLIAAWPLVLAHEPRARLVVTGFGAYRAGVERLIGALADGDLDAIAELVAEGRGAEGGPIAPLRLLPAFLTGLTDAERADYLAAARGLRERIVLVGRLDHDELVDLLPACEAQIVPSTFPEAFGMVAAEAAACGSLPVCADHSGLAEVARALAEAVPPAAAPWLSFPVGEEAVRAIAQRLCAWLDAPADVRADTRAALVATARELWSWEGVARGVLAAAEGRVDELPAPLPLGGA